MFQRPGRILFNVATVECVWSGVNIYQPNIVNILVNGLLGPQSSVPAAKAEFSGAEVGKLI